MRRATRRPFVVTFAALGVGCGASDVARPTVDAEPPAADARFDGSVDDGGPSDALVAGARAPATPHVPRRIEGTVGDRCAGDATCDPAGSGENFCSNDGSFSGGTLYPAPVCLGRVCTPGPDLASPAACDVGRGVCVASGTLSGVCLPRCSFDDRGGAPTGCPALDPCAPYAWSTDAAGRTTGTGYCIAGCLRDEDCTGGDRCQVDQGYCVTRPFPRTLKVGDPCFAASNPPEVECNCLFAPNGGDGYCTRFCLVDDARTTCPAGFVCTAALPASRFAREPVGAAGSCLLSCATDLDCAPVHSTCVETPHGRVCVPKDPAVGDAGAPLDGGTDGATGGASDGSLDGG